MKSQKGERPGRRRIKTPIRTPITIPRKSDQGPQLATRAASGVRRKPGARARPGFPLVQGGSAGHVRGQRLKVWIAAREQSAWKVARKSAIAGAASGGPRRCRCRARSSPRQGVREDKRRASTARDGLRRCRASQGMTVCVGSTPRPQTRLRDYRRVLVVERGKCSSAAADVRVHDQRGINATRCPHTDRQGFG